MTKFRLLRWTLILYNIEYQYFEDILELFWNFLRPLIERVHSFCLISEERSCDIVHFLFNNFSKFQKTGLELSVQISFRGRTRNSLKGHYRNKIKGDCRSELYFEQGVQICFLKYFVFKVLEVEDFGLLVPKIPNYVTYDLNYCVTRSLF